MVLGIKERQTGDCVPLSTPAGSNELPVAFLSSGLMLRGMLHLPAKSRNFPVCVFCHGYFQSNRVGPFGLYVQVARALASHGVACLRFDCRGFGESEGNYLEVSYRGLAKDLANAVKVAKKIAGVDTRRVGLIAHSLGANIAIQVASSDFSIETLCLLSPDASSSDKSKVFTNRQLRELRKDGRTVRNGIPASSKVYDEIRDGVTFTRASQIHAMVTLIYGNKDPYFVRKDYAKLAKSFQGSVELKKISGANHNFLPVDCRRELMKTILLWADSSLCSRKLSLRERKDNEAP